MSIQPPKIDKRTYQDIVEQTKELVEKDTKWCPRSDGKPDAGMALIRIFSRMAALVSDRLNQVPEKNFLAFLDLIGTQILPPQPARVPLTFSLASGVPENTEALVPAYTQIAAPPSEGEEEEVVFETQNNLIVTPVQLQAVFVRQPDADRYSHWIQKTNPFPICSGERRIPHYFYIACDQLFTLPFPKNVSLKINLSNRTNKENLQYITWHYWNGTDWQSLSVDSPAPTQNLWEVSISNMPCLAQITINGKNAAWLRAEYNQPILPTLSLEFCQLIANANNTDYGNLNIAPKVCFFNTVTIDLSKDFYPFGEQPHFNDAFYIALDEAFAKPNAQVTLKVILTPAPPLPVNPSPDLEINWEVWNGTNWELVPNKSYKFTKDEDIAIILPAKIEPTIVGGENRYWVRARIVKGNYGTENTTQVTSFSILTELADKSQIITVNSVRGFLVNDNLWVGSGNDREEAIITKIEFDTKTLTLNQSLKNKHLPGTIVSLRSTSVFGPPSVHVLTLSYTYNSGDTPLSVCQTYNDFKYVDRTNEANQNQPWSPYTPTEDKDLGLYLGFDKPFPNRAIALYFQVEPPKPEEVASTDNLSESKPVRLVWEYSNGSGWNRLGVVDETKAFTERGLIRFVGPSDFQARSEFGQSLYWLRVRKESGEFRVPPRLRRILTNTIWAVQATTLNNEVLGSSDGNPNQTFWTTQTPVLQGQQLEVQEGKEPLPEEKAILSNVEGKDAIALVQDEVGQIEAVWVRWHQVTDFYESKSRDRHYIMNHLTGEIQFGDGQQGMIPPQGRNNIRMARYRTDGGERGNKPANTITQLKTTIPYIDRVINLEAAGGGSDRESIERVKERGPKFLRHRGRAVTVQDFEDLAYEASPDVARVKAISAFKTGSNYPDFRNPLKLGLPDKPQNTTENSKEYEKQLKPYQNIAQNRQVQLLIVPKSAEKQPIPSLALIDCVRNYLRVRCTPTVDFQVIAPDWLQISVTADIVLRSLDITDSIQTVTRISLEEFLHPLTGNAGQGWNFGEQPYESDLYALLQSINGVDYIRSLTINVTPSRKLSNQEQEEQRIKQLIPPSFLIYSGSHTLNFIF